MFYPLCSLKIHIISSIKQKQNQKSCVAMSLTIQMLTCSANIYIIVETSLFLYWVNIPSGKHTRISTYFYIGLIYPRANIPASLYILIPTHNIEGKYTYSQLPFHPENRGEECHASRHITGIPSYH